MMAMTMSLCGYKYNEEEEQDDDKDFMSDFLSWDDDLKEVPRKRGCR
jgi:hypothetical protein